MMILGVLIGSRLLYTYTFGDTCFLKNYAIWDACAVNDASVDGFKAVLVLQDGSQENILSRSVGVSVVLISKGGTWLDVIPQKSLSRTVEAKCDRVDDDDFVHGWLGWTGGW